ncbi:PASTA domain-containing protein [Daejeonella lutea]|uniref:PASTA domain-containing protein n=1 Tax=Daejeonella lutea TaxID=572036 RepID=A0A1T5AI56_9SPHI|nr:PASTA domain-containing protein [Daejeonella lutea]SKB34692.1 PASTA domain-containing protein [Daejeonella lutea]
MSKFLDYLKTKTFRKNLIIATVSIISFLLVIFYSLGFYTHHGEGMPVPKLKGLSIERAIELLEAEGLRYQINDSVYLIDKQPGIVVEQDPDPNTNVKANRTIYLIITRDAPNIKFPDIAGKTFLEVRSILNNYQLKVGDTTYVSDVARDVVISSSFGGNTITRGAQIPKGSRVDLVLGDGLGASEVDIPNLLGLTLSEIKFPLGQASLVLGSVTYEGTIRDSTNAKVIKQFPALSDTLNKISMGTPIDVVLSNQE